jgi:hypothetical protein
VLRLAGRSAERAWQDRDCLVQTSPIADALSSGHAKSPNLAGSARHSPYRKTQSLDSSPFSPTPQGSLASSTWDCTCVPSCEYRCWEDGWALYASRGTERHESRKREYLETSGVLAVAGSLSGCSDDDGQKGGEMPVMMVCLQRVEILWYD